MLAFALEVQSTRLLETAALVILLLCICLLLVNESTVSGSDAWMLSEAFWHGECAGERDLWIE